MTARELYRQLRPFLEICPDLEVTVHVPEGDTLRTVYPHYLDRSDHGDRVLALICDNGDEG